MPRLRTHDPVRTLPIQSQSLKAIYSVHRREDCWFIAFEGTEYGPYATADEALLFAINAAQKLGERGREAAVQRLDTRGKVSQVWTYGEAYPPVL